MEVVVENPPPGFFRDKWVTRLDLPRDVTVTYRVMSSAAIEPQTSWPALIYAKRRDLGITQEALADRLGVTRNAVCMWESTKDGTPVPNEANRRKLVAVLAISDAELASLYRDPEAAA